MIRICTCAIKSVYKATFSVTVLRSGF